MRNKYVLLMTFLLLYFHKITFGEQIFSLNEAINLAIKSNHYIKAKEYSLFAIKEEKESAKSEFYPKLYLEERFTKGNYNSHSVFTKLNQQRLTMDKFFNPGEVNNFQTILGIEMPIFVRELHINKNIKDKLYLSYESQYRRFKEDIAFEVFKSYLGVISAKSMLNVIEKALIEAKEIYRIAQIRVKSGVGIKSDELRAFVFMKDKESDLIKAKNDVLVAKRALGLLLSTEEPIDVTDLDLEKIKILPPIDDAMKSIGENRMDLVSDTYIKDSAKEAIELFKSRLYPKIMLSANYFNDDKSAPFGRDGSGYVASIYLRWDIFDKTRYDEIRKSKFEFEKAKEFLNQKEKEIGFKVFETYLRAEESKEKLEVAKNTVKEAEETFRLIKIRYDNNLATMVEVLDGELALTTAKTNLVNAEVAYLEALGKVLYESGVFLNTFLK
jgi:outer membrane protein TolC